MKRIPSGKNSSVLVVTYAENKRYGNKKNRENIFGAKLLHLEGGNIKRLIVN